MAQELWQRYHQQNPDTNADTENALIQKYLPLVSAVVSRLAMTLPEHVDHDDLYSVGLIGLLQALRNYNPACGTSFETYARVRVRGAMLDELRRMDWVPRTIHEKARRIKDSAGRTGTKARQDADRGADGQGHESVAEGISGTARRSPPGGVCLSGCGQRLRRWRQRSALRSHCRPRAAKGRWKKFPTTS